MRQNYAELLSVFTLLHLFGVCANWEIMHFHDYCGSEITEDAGELRFDAQNIPTYLSQGRCSVTINTKTSSIFSVTRTKVLFYFTKFELSSSCKDINVSIEDSTVYSGDKINGLPYYICGTNKSLEQSNQMFTSDRDRIAVTVRRYSYGTSIPGTFILKYIKVYTGECNTDDLYQCSNGNCIPSKYHCADDIKPCGPAEQECSFLDNIERTIERTIQKYSWVIIVVIALCALRVFVKKNRTASRIVTSAWSSIENIILCKRQEPAVHGSSDSETADQHHRETGNTPDVHRQSDIPHLSDNHDPTSFETHDTSGNSGDMGTSHGISGTSSAPPPSYDEVMSSAYNDNTAERVN